jgi:hypothetical protein
MLDGDSNFFTGWRWLQLSPLLSGRSPGFVVMRAAGQARRSRRYILPDAGRLHPRADSTRVLGGSVATDRSRGPTGRSPSGRYASAATRPRLRLIAARPGSSALRMIVTSCAQCSSSARSAKSRTAPAAKSAATIAAAADSGGNDRIHRRARAPRR